MSLARIGLELTTRCNLNCKHCLREPNQKPTDLPLPLLERILDQAIAGYELESIPITGGEPLLHPKFDAVLTAIASRGLAFSIVTNGLLLPKNIQLLSRPDLKKALGHVAVSLEGDSPQLHDSIRGPGTYKKAMAGTLALKTAGLPFGFKFAIGAHNHDRLEPATLAMAHLGPAFINFTHITPTPDNLRAGLVLSPDQRRQVEDVVRRLAAEIKTTITLSADLYCGGKFYTCAALAMTELYIDAKGRLCFCCVLPGLRGGGGDKAEIIADLNQVDLLAAHQQLIAAIADFQRHRLDRLRAGDLAEVDVFQCVACAQAFHKMDWLDATNAAAWLEPVKEKGKR